MEHHGHSDLVDVSGLSLDDLDSLDRTTLWHVLSEILDPCEGDAGDVVAAFNAALPPSR
ncbi:FxSxx-COOH protein [Actinocorallia sp. API 0066]|uniref:FxSxx-COOH cyclophane-containing RiPP peptide n=1 Tax=Actinocorallia sp. API 0066 TaxID=2896846 RepID=UPI001E49A0F1|nr:FxSxx-COOH cyclophane-containing RiPP peptide [Actinocorallia sp. API 0066]MCD0452582.1 FxSxx-COOH protein [Actinocorallia sp. API 0066]